MIAKSAASLALAALVTGALSTAPASSLAASTLDPSARPERLVTLSDGRRLNLRCSGIGRPTVLLEGGYAATSLAWVKVQPRLARRYRTCAYDRAGYGFSDMGPLPRDGAAVALDLDRALRAARIAGPFIVVGHSAGGLYVRLFADRRPRDVVGMVLVDPSVEFQDKRMQAVFGPGAGAVSGMRARAQHCLEAALAADPAHPLCAPSPGPDPAVNAARLTEAARPSTWRTQISELDSLWTTTSAEAARGRASYGALPLIVLTADGTYAAAPAAARAAVDRLWTDFHREMAARSTVGQEQRVAGSSHMMMFDRPDAIVAAVDAVAAEGKRKPVQ